MSMRTMIAAILGVGAFLVCARFASADEPTRGVYYGSNVFGRQTTTANITGLLRDTEVNTVIVDKKDDDGREIAGERFQTITEPFRKEGARIMCRIVTLKDNAYAKKEPGSALALKSISHPDRIWTDNKGNAYLDPALEGSAEYISDVSIRAIRDGCDSLNFDYIRLPSGVDGAMKDTKYSSLLADHAAKRRVMQLFLSRMVTAIRKEYPRVPLAASVFGYACYGFEPGVGQYLDDFAALGFSISCMAYPTHYDCNDEAPDPSTAPYKIYHKTGRLAKKYLAEKGYPHAEFIMWLQGFNLMNINGCGLGTDKNGKTIGIRGKKSPIVDYDHDPVRFREQGRALDGIGIHSWLVWHPGARYQRNLFRPKSP
ncbi:MAG: hypothetical protein A3C16_01715 [Candidatus Sungbacteria bacterium RIFCSPHIGHO2_02_FULL_51_29]|uniref:DUF4015 domain-containing protein n=1 Tax=Candidatus Sungbacteria bacterium RIFCSPHIGHO2_02_FULL_51_29 TaxID=1802273 RepID=A0A1G2KVE8_9BACT|nr:MAG: hypothetical protein A3C16_01715 [Candidatus Sungbacteria bacterium RIFCSPHIGHO2_02_FULL_51_29]